MQSELAKYRMRRMEQTWTPSLNSRFRIGQIPEQIQQQISSLPILSVKAELIEVSISIHMYVCIYMLMYS